MVHISELIRFEMDLIQREMTIFIKKLSKFVIISQCKMSKILTTSSKNEIIKILQRKMNTQNNPI